MGKERRRRRRGDEERKMEEGEMKGEESRQFSESCLFIGMCDLSKRTNNVTQPTTPFANVLRYQVCRYRVVDFTYQQDELQSNVVMKVGNE